MLSLNHFETFIPESRISIASLEKETKLPKEMLAIYRTIYGLRKVPIWKDSLESLLLPPLEKLFEKQHCAATIKYLIYLHTAPWILPFGDDLLQRIQKKFGLSHAIAWGSTQYKCVSFIKILEILSVLLNQQKNFSAVVITGEIAFTSELRVVPRSTIVGDAATASLFSVSGDAHQVVSVVNQLLPGYARGIELLENDLRSFDADFIQTMVDVIHCAILRANITVTDITLILPHNVNIPTWKKIAAKLIFPIEKIYLNNIPTIGHCFCSDHIINLQSALSEGYLKKGDYYLMAGCGLGFYLSAAVLRV